MADIDLSNPESRNKYLKENLGNLMQGIDANYGQVLMDELMRRMEVTVSEFNEEVKAMLGQLQGVKPTPKENILNTAPQRPAPQAPAAQPAAAPPPPPQAAAPAPPPVTPEPPATDLKPTPAMDEPVVEPDLPKFDETLDAPDPFQADAGDSDNIKEVEIEVDLPEDQLSDFEKKLRSLTQ